MTLVLMLHNAQGKQRPKKRWLSWAEKTPGLPKEIGGVQSRLSNLKKPKLLQFYKEVFSTVKAFIFWMYSWAGCSLHKGTCRGR